MNTILPSLSKKMPALSKMRLTLPRLSIPLLAMLALNGCGTTPPPSLALYQQPPTLHLAAGKPVQTSDGTYTPANNETWYSEASNTHNTDLIIRLSAQVQTLQQRLDSKP